MDYDLIVYTAAELSDAEKAKVQSRLAGMYLLDNCVFFSGCVADRRDEAGVSRSDRGLFR